MPSEHTKHNLQRLQTEVEDEFDDLDDVLDDFDQSSNSAPSAPPPSATATTAPTVIGNRPRNNTRVDAPPISIPGSGSRLPATEEEKNLDEGELRDDFARELAKGMEELMKEITNDIATGDKTGSSDAPAKSGGSDGTETTDQERAQALKAAWEAMLVEGLDGSTDTEGLGEPLGEGGIGQKTASKGPAVPINDFQARIQQAMNKLKESESNLKPDSSGAGGEDDPASLDALLKSLGDLGLGENGEDDAELANFLENMMGQLMSKDVLYEPLKELGASFPGYLANPPSPLERADRERYEKQYSHITQILAVFEKPDYSDTNSEDSQTIVKLMTEMQAHGQPPSELLGDLPPGFETGLPRPGDDCVIA